MLRCFYGLLLYLFTPLILLRLLWRARKNPAYLKRWGERFAHFTLPDHYQHAIWVHAVSVGESMIAIPFVNAVKKEYSGVPVIVTTTTPTGSDCVRRALGDSVFHVYAPYDLPHVVKRFLKKTAPRVLIVFETEIWPNLFYYTHEAHIPIMIANARLSDTSIDGYLRFKNFFANILASVDKIAVQTEMDAARFRALHVSSEKIIVTGNIKFDIEVSASIEESAALLRQQLGQNRKIFIAGSTHEGEEEIVLMAYRKIKEASPTSLLILVPRHPERFNSVKKICVDQGLKFAMRSQNAVCEVDTDVYLGDTMGEMLLLYAASDVAFIGGSLVPTGGHNLLEAAAFSLPLLTGPQTFNFKQVIALLKHANAVVIVEDAETLSEQVVAFFEDPEECAVFGERAYQVVIQNRGALNKHLKILHEIVLK